MNYNIAHYFKRKRINISDIIYLTRKTPHTVITLMNGESYLTNIPVKEIAAFLSAEEFINISKGRKRNISQHKYIRQKFNLPTIIPQNKSAQANPSMPLSLLEKCSLLDEMPLAFCVIELVFDKDGHGVDFVFRYCNDEMAVVEGVPVADMINRSFYKVFENGDKKWLVTYADVALNGTKRIIHDYSPEINKNLTIHCFQPSPGYCACVLIPTD